MARESLPTARLTPTQTDIKAKSSGIIKTITKMATANWNTHTFNSYKIDFVSIKNAGTESVRVAWNTDDKDAVTNPEYTVLIPGERLVTIGITKDTELHFKRDSGTGGHRLEILAWG